MCVLRFCLGSLYTFSNFISACPSHDRYMCVYKECLSKYRDINKEPSTLTNIDIVDESMYV